MARLKEEVDRHVARKNREVRYNVSLEVDVFVARCLDVALASDVATEAAAVAALQEALELYLEDIRQTPSSNGDKSSKSSGHAFRHIVRRSHYAYQ